MNGIEFTTKQNKVVTWMIALQISFQYICAALEFSGISILLAFILIVFSLFLIAKHKIKIMYTFLMITLFIILSFLFSIILLPEIDFTINYFERFLLFGVVALLLGFQVEDKEIVVCRVILIGTVFLPLILMVNTSQMNTGNQMGFAYACLPVMIASFIGLSYKKRYFALSIINIYTILMAFRTFAPRGVWLIIAISIALLICWKFCIGKSKNERIVSFSFVMIIFLIVGYYIVNNLEFIITAVNNLLLNNFDTRVYALEKYLRYLEQGKMLNGRDDLWILAMNIISEKPLLGNGIGYYENISGGSYCHNIILEALCEGGFLFIVPIIIYIGGRISRLINSFFKANAEDFHWQVFSFCLGIVVLFFSSSYWMYPVFWFFVGEYIYNSRN